MIKVRNRAAARWPENWDVLGPQAALPNVALQPGGVIMTAGLVGCKRFVATVSEQIHDVRAWRDRSDLASCAVSNGAVHDS
jgi:hypothetical protein